MPTALPILAASVAVLGVGALYTLHRLRAKPDRVVAPTLLFWRHAARPQQTKVLWARRVSHRKTFALLSAIAVLAAVGMVAAPFARGRDGPRDVVVIDSGATMNAAADDGRTLLGHAVEQASAEWANAAPALISAGPTPLLVAAPGQPAAVLRHELTSFRPRPGASASRLAIELAAAVQGDRPGRLIWYTADRDVPAGLPPDIARRIERRSVGTAAAVALTAVSFEAGDTNDARGTLRVTVAGTNPDAAVVVKTRAGSDKAAEQSVRLRDGRAVADFDVAADGQSVAIDLDGAAGPDALHHTTFALPDRRPLTFRFVGTVPDALRAALLTCGAAADDGAVAVLARGTAVPPGVRAVVVVEPSTKVVPPTPLALADGSARPASLEQARVQSVPASPLPGTALLAAGGTSVVSLDLTAIPTLHVSESVVADAAELPRRAAFPVLVGDWLDRLGGRTRPPAVVSWQRAADDPLWPGVDDRQDAGRLLAVAEAHAAPTTAPADSTPRAAVARGTPWAEIVLGLALVLAVVEGLLLAGKKIV